MLVELPPFFSSSFSFLLGGRGGGEEGGVLSFCFEFVGADIRLNTN